MASVRLESPPPAEQIYQSYLPGKYIGYFIENYFTDRFPFLSFQEWKSKIQKGDISVNGKTAGLGTVLKEHDFIVTNMGIRQEPPANRKLFVIYEDDNIRVFNKGAPLPIHPSGRYFKNSMTEILKEHYKNEIPRPVQRLDALTTGVVVFAKTSETAAALTEEFTNNRVYKEYLALVDCKDLPNQFSVDAPIGKIKGSARGVGPNSINPKPALTDFEKLITFNGITLLKVIPRTGRTNQIRVHLSLKGAPLTHDPVYGNSSEGNLGLHAYKLKINFKNRIIDLKASLPPHFEEFLKQAKFKIK